MRGRFLHNQGLIDPVAAAFKRLGGIVRREYPIRPGRYSRYVDLHVVWDSWRIVVEAELTVDRVDLDVDKASALEADILLFVVPNSALARKIERKLKDVSRPVVLVLPLGAALVLLANKNRLMRALKGRADFSSNIGGTS